MTSAAFVNIVDGSHAARWRAEITLTLARTFAALLLLPATAILASRVRDGRLASAAIGLTVYSLLVVAALHRRMAVEQRVTIILVALAAIAFNIILGRGLGFNVGVIAGTFALLTLLAWGRAAAGAAVAAWVAVLTAAAVSIATGRLTTASEHGAIQILMTVGLWTALTALAVTALCSVIVRLEGGVHNAEALARRLRSEARERLAVMHRLVSDEEALRGTLARELHDDIGQRLTAIKITLETARVHRQQALAVACQESARLVHDLRRDVALSANLRPTVIEDGDLTAAIRALVRDETRRAGVAAVVDIPDGIGVSADAQFAPYRIIQEALTNAIRHSRAGNITVRATRVNGGIMFVVSDDGVGFDVEAARQRGITGERLGLLGMRERAEGMGAVLEVVSAPQQGTEIRLFVTDGTAA